MYGIKLDNYIPEPNPALSNRIIAVHYYPAWTPGAAGLHGGFDDLHNFPERTPILGYYDEANPMATDYEIKWALEHGINCFVYCWYRKKHNERLPVTVSDIRCGHGIHEGLFKAKFGNMMNFAIMYENGGRWGETDKDDLLTNLMPFWIDNYFKRENYLKIDNKPVLFICGKPGFDGYFSSAQEQIEALDACREMLRREGLDGMLIGACIWDYNNADTEAYLDIERRGYDFSFSYNAGYAPDAPFPSDEEIINGQCSMLKKRLSVNPKSHIPLASCFRDATPRTTEAWNRLGFNFADETPYHLSPNGFRQTLLRMNKIVDELPNDSLAKKIFMLDNWNEWDEGHYISPCHEHGFKYLQAVREELTYRNNLPDYRSPADLGLIPDTSWHEPDLSEICKRKREKH